MAIAAHSRLQRVAAARPLRASVAPIARPRFVAARFTVTVQDPEGAPTVTFPCSPEQTILEAAMDAGVELPVLCRAAACSVCTGKLVQGQVEHDANSSLEEWQRQAGYALLCGVRPRSDVTVLTKQELTMHAEMCKH